MHTEQAKEEATRYLTTSQTKTNLVHITINQCVGIQITERTAVNRKQASMANLDKYGQYRHRQTMLQ